MTADETGCLCFGPQPDSRRERPLSSIRPLGPALDRTAGRRLTWRDGQAGTEGRFTRSVVRLNTWSPSCWAFFRARRARERPGRRSRRPAAGPDHFLVAWSGRETIRDCASEGEVERLVDEPVQPPAKSVGTAVDLGEPAQTRLEREVRVLDRDDRLVDSRLGLDRACLGIGLAGDFTAGHVRELRGDLVPASLGDLRDLAQVGGLGPAVDLDPGAAAQPDQVDIGLIDDQVCFDMMGVAHLAERLARLEQLADRFGMRDAHRLAVPRRDEGQLADLFIDLLEDRLQFFGGLEMLTSQGAILAFRTLIVPLGLGEADGVVRLFLHEFLLLL